MFIVEDVQIPSLEMSWRTESAALASLPSALQTTRPRGSTIENAKETFFSDIHDTLCEQANLQYPKASPTKFLSPLNCSNWSSAAISDLDLKRLIGSARLGHFDISKPSNTVR